MNTKTLRTVTSTVSLILITMLIGCTGPTSNKVNHQEPTSEDGIHGRGSGTQKWWDALPREEWSAFERVETGHAWFEVYRVLPDVYAIYEPHQFEEVISFLITGKKKALLFDTGLGVAAMKPIVSQLTELDVIVVNSHSHYDHVGGNHEFDSVSAVDTPFTRRALSGRSHDDVGEFVRGDWMAKPIPEGIDVSNYASQPYELSGFVDDGTVIDLGGRRLEIVLTPGHTPDSLCLLDRENRLLFTGDTFYLAALYTHLYGADFDDYRATADRLAELAPHVDRLLTSHNVPIASGEYLIKLKAAFDSIVTESAEFRETDGAREYLFDRFSIIALPQ